MTDNKTNTEVESILLKLLTGNTGMDRAVLVHEVCVRSSFVTKEKAEQVIDNALRRMKTKGLVKVVKQQGRKPYWAVAGTT